MIIVEGIFIIFAIVIFIVLAAIGYVLYEVYNSLPTTNCSSSAPLGTENSSKCPPGTESYGRVCYKDVWTEEGGTKVAI